MACTQCGNEITLTHTHGGIEQGHFVEEYQCSHCKAEGQIIGDAGDEPEQWTKTGRVFYE